MGKREEEPTERSDNPAVIAIDPGGTTGWAVFVVHPDALSDPDCAVLDNVLMWHSGQYDGPEIEQEVALNAMFDMWPDAAIVYEDFTLRHFSMDSALLSPVRITSVGEYHLSTSPLPRPLFKQQPSMAKSTATDDRLKLWHYYDPASGPHARDAVRHGLTFLRRAKTQPKLRSAAWPWIYGGEIQKRSAS